VQAKTNVPVLEFVGQFGMPNLDKLNIILNIPEYKDSANISVIKQEKNGVSLLAGVKFENKTSDFKNEYRFMAAELVNDQLKSVKFKGVVWNVEFVPTAQNIMRLKFMASANSEENTFVAKTENGALKFYFGDHSSHAGDFVFADNVVGNLTKGFNWPIAVVQSILALPGDKVFRFSDEGASQITVDSGLATYKYILPAQQK